MKFFTVYLLSGAHIWMVGSLETRLASPVEKVVGLLQKLKKNVKQDAETEEKAYNKFACWCHTSTKQKADAVDKATSDIRKYGQEILSLKGLLASLVSEIEDITNSISNNQQMQEEATTLRQKDNTAFMEETDETKQALAALEKAMTSLGEATQSSLLQKTSVQHVLQNLPTGAHSAKSQQISFLSEFMHGQQQREEYAPQSMTVQGILKDMYDTFSTDLETLTRKEATANRDFEAYIATKSKELKHLKESKSSKTKQKVAVQADLADTTALYDNTQATKESDIKFFDTTTETCHAKYEEWSKRKKLRSDELEGFDRALIILTRDDSREMFERAIDNYKSSSPAPAESLLQVSSKGTLTRRQHARSQQAITLLKAHGKRSSSLRLLRVAARIREAKGHFDEVLKLIDQMMTTVREEEYLDGKKKVQCRKQLAEDEWNIKYIAWQVKTDQADIDKLVSKISGIDDQTAKATEDIKSTEALMRDMTSARAQENAAFLQGKGEDLFAIKMLEQAKSALLEFYTKNKIDVSFEEGSAMGSAQKKKEPTFEIEADQAPTFTMSDKASRSLESKNIIAILSKIIQDLDDELKNSIKNEERLQLDYEKSLKAAKDLKQDLLDKKDNLREIRADKRSDRIIASMTKDSNTKERQEYVDHKAKILPDCKWIIDNFSERYDRRQAELAGLSGAKDLLAGANQEALLQAKQEEQLDRIMPPKTVTPESLLASKYFLST